MRRFINIMFRYTQAVKWWQWPVLAVGAFLCASFCALVGLLAVTYIRVWEVELPGVGLNGTSVYDRRGSVIGMIGQRWVDPDSVSAEFKRCLMLVEDRDFERHGGVSVRGMFRAAFTNIWSMSLQEGGSTLTQQLARRLFLSKRKAFKRKAEEIAIAIRVEQKYHKGQILGAYLACLWFPKGIQGIQDAALTFFGKQAKQLDYNESAAIVAIIRAPGRYDPFRNYSLFKARHQHILRQLLAAGLISPKQYATYCLRPPVFRSPEQDGRGYALAYVRQELKQRSLITATKVATTFDLDAIETAGRVIQQSLSKLDELFNVSGRGIDSLPQAAFVMVENHTAELLVAIGGRNHRMAPTNRCFRRRQIGSLIKPYVYAMALDQGLQPGSLILDAPVTVKEDGHIWSPANFKSRYAGNTIARNVVTNSLNAGSVRILRKLDRARIVERLRQFGFQLGPIAYPSLALGCMAASPMEMAASYSSFGNAGVRHEVRVISSIADSRGRESLCENSVPTGTCSEEVAFVVLDALRSVVTDGTARRAFVSRQLPTNRIGGKTGTTNSDAWFVGVTPHFTIAVWIGFDDQRPLLAKGGTVTGGSVAAELCAEFIQRYPSVLQGSFNSPGNAVYLPVDVHSGRGSKNGIPIPFLLKTVKD